MAGFPRGLPLATKSGTPFKYKSLDTQSEAWMFFYNNYAQHPVPQVGPSDVFRYNFLPFSCKVFALAEAAWDVKNSVQYQMVELTNKGPQGNSMSDPKFDLFLWLDADVLIKNQLSSATLVHILGDNSLAWLDRQGGFDYGETGFILSSTKDASLDIYMEQANLWGSGMLFDMKEWHDAFTFSSCVKMREYIDSDFKVKNLNQDLEGKIEQGLYPMRTSMLNTYLDHKKGNLKESLNGNQG